ENIPTGVISLSGTGIVLGSNTAARRLFGRDPADVGRLGSLFKKEDARDLEYLIKRAARMGHASRQAELEIGGRTVNLAITVSSMVGEPPGSAGSGQSKGWFVVVLDDLSDLMRAQKAAAWGEVAQRVAHEIKNPLTPIALSAERIRLWLDRAGPLGNRS